VAFFLRSERQARWLVHPDIPWLNPGELQADVLLDLQIQDNSLSIWEISDQIEKRRVITALAANRKYFSPLDYVIFEDSTFAALGLIFEQKSGITPDALVNTAHYDITHLTIGKLNLFANLLSNSSRDRFPEKEVEAAVREAYRDGILIENSLEPSMLEKLQQGV
jgi:hypothetical protein